MNHGFHMCVIVAGLTIGSVACKAEEPVSPREAPPESTPAPPSELQAPAPSLVPEAERGTGEENSPPGPVGCGFAVESEIEAEAERAKHLLAPNPAGARDAYLALLECEDRPAWRVKLGFAFERAEQPCSALSEYRRVVGQLEGREHENVARRIVQLAPSCEI